MREEYAKEYHAFLVRFWRDGPKRPWRVTMSDPHTQRAIHFATVDELLTYFETLTADTAKGTKGADEGTLGTS